MEAGMERIEGLFGKWREESIIQVQLGLERFMAI